MKRLTLVTLAAFGLAVAPISRAAEFTLFVFEAKEALALRDAPGDASARYWQAYADFGAMLAKSGVMRGGAALAPDGTVQHGALVLGGYFVIDVASTADAQKWAALAPARAQGGDVIVVPAIVSPAMASPSP